MNLFKKKQKPSKEAHISKKRKGMMTSGNANTFSATVLEPETISGSDQIMVEKGTRNKSFSGAKEFEYVQVFSDDNQILNYDQRVKHDYISTMDPKNSRKNDK